jgi:hypothetical protein
LQRKSPLALQLENTVLGELVEDRGNNVLSDRHGGDEPLALAIFRQVSESVRKHLAGFAYIDLGPVNCYGSSIGRGDAEQAPSDLRSPSAYQSEHADNFSGPQAE